MRIFFPVARQPVWVAEPSGLHFLDRSLNRRRLRAAEGPRINNFRNRHASQLWRLEICFDLRRRYVRRLVRSNDQFLRDDQLWSTDTYGWRHGTARGMHYIDLRGFWLGYRKRDQFCNALIARKLKMLRPQEPRSEE